MPYYSTLEQSRKAMFDPEVLEWIGNQKTYKVPYLNSNGDLNVDRPDHEEDDLFKSTLIASKRKDGGNALFFDVDRSDLYIAKSSSGNYHVGIYADIEDEDFKKVVRRLRDMGIYQHSNAAWILDDETDEDDEPKVSDEEAGIYASVRTPWTFKPDGYDNLRMDLTTAANERFGTKKIITSYTDKEVEVAKGVKAKECYFRLSYNTLDGPNYLYLTMGTDGQVEAKGFCSSIGTFAYFKPRDFDGMLDWLEFNSNVDPKFHVVF